MAARQNSTFNPRVASNATNWAQWGVATVARVTNQSPPAAISPNGASLQASALGAAGHGCYAFCGAAGFQPTVPGDVWASAAYFKATAGKSIGVFVYFADSGFGFLGVGYTNTTASGGWDRGVVDSTKTLEPGSSVIAPASSAWALGPIVLNNTDTTTIHVVGAQFEKVSKIGPYFDGDSGGGSTWTGPAHASESLLELGAVHSAGRGQ